MLLNQGRRYIEKMIHGFKTIWKNFNCWHLNTQGESWYVVLYKNMIRRGPRVHEVWQSLRSHQSNVIAVKFVKACGCNPSLWCSSLDFGTWTRADVRLVVLYATRKSTMTHHSMLSAAPPVVTSQWHVHDSAAWSSMVEIIKVIWPLSVFLRAPQNHTESAFVGDVGALLGAPLCLERRQGIGGIRWAVIGEIFGHNLLRS